MSLVLPFSVTAAAVASSGSTKLPPALVPKTGFLRPVQVVKGSFNFSKLSADKVLVVDANSRRIILSKNAQVAHPLASLTKLMTAILVTEQGFAMNRVETVLPEDEVGGARLRVMNGTPLTMRDLFYAMLVGSANNAAHALARITGKPLPAFITAMNTKAQTLGLTSTVFTDTSGIDVGNSSTAQDIAALALTAFDNQKIRSAASTAYYPLTIDGQTRKMKNTNSLLTDPNNGLYVLGGKTGYLLESKWNFVVKMMDARKRPLLVVVLGSASQADSAKDAATVAKWVWSHYQWKK